MASWGPRLVDSPAATKLADLAGAKYDLETAIAFCEELQVVDSASPTGRVLADALSTAIAIRYSRSFTTGVRTRLTDDVVSGLPDYLRAVHDILRVVRDKHVAHSVNALEENLVTVHVREPPDPPALGGISTLQARTAVLNEDSASLVRELIEALVAAVNRLMAEQQAIVKAEVQSLPLERVYEFPEPGPYLPDWTNIDLPRRRPRTEGGRKGR